MEKKTFTKESLLKEIMRKKDGTFRALIALGLSGLVLYKLLNLTQLINGSTQYVIVIVILAIIFWVASFSACYYVFYTLTYKMISKQQLIDFKKEKINKLSKEIDVLIEAQKETRILLNKYSEDLGTHISLFLHDQNKSIDPQKISMFILLLQTRVSEFEKYLDANKNSTTIEKLKESFLDEEISPDEYKLTIELFFLSTIVNAIKQRLKNYQQQVLNDSNINPIGLGIKIRESISLARLNSLDFFYFFNSKKELLEKYVSLLRLVVI